MNQKKKFKKKLDTVVTTLRNVADNFLNQMKNLSLHLFIVKWQYREFTRQHREVKGGTAISVLVFAENYRSASQDKVQSAEVELYAEWTKVGDLEFRSIRSLSCKIDSINFPRPSLRESPHTGEWALKSPNRRKGLGS